MIQKIALERGESKALESGGGEVYAVGTLLQRVPTVYFICDSDGGTP